VSTCHLRLWKRKKTELCTYKFILGLDWATQQNKLNCSHTNLFWDLTTTSRGKGATQHLKVKLDGGIKARIFLVLLMTLFSSWHVYVHTWGWHYCHLVFLAVPWPCCSRGIFPSSYEGTHIAAKQSTCYLKSKGTIYTLQKGNINLLTKLKEILDCWNVKVMERPTWTNEICFCLHAQSLYFEH